MNWLAQVAFYGGMALGSSILPHYSSVGAGVYAKVKNPTADTAVVFVIAARVDSAVRPIAFLAPGDSAYAKLPYEDTPVVLIYLTRRGGWWAAPDSLYRGTP